MKKVMTRLALATLFMFAFVVTANQANAATDAQVKGVHTVTMPATKVTFPDGSVLVHADETNMKHKTHVGPAMSGNTKATLFSLGGIFDSVKKVAGTALAVGGGLASSFGGMLMGPPQQPGQPQ